MDELTKEEFERMKNAAAEKVRELYRGRGQTLPPFPDFVRVPENKQEANTFMPEAQKTEAVKKAPQKKAPQSRAESLLRHINLPEMLKDKDALLLLGLILLLINEDADESLVMALAYILL